MTTNVTSLDEQRQHVIGELIAAHTDTSYKPYTGEDKFRKHDCYFWTREDGAHDKVVHAYMEIKARKIASTKHDTIFLSHQKWIHLRETELRLKVPSYFVAGFTDDVILLFPSAAVECEEPGDPFKFVVSGRTKQTRPKHVAPNDEEAIIEVPVELMVKLEMWGGFHGTTSIPAADAPITEHDDLQY